ncbi:MAG TPA: ABC transporter permease [Gemmatimonadaceae bacterium]|nr:ABC transporter permease [Gemmatimonadaceae bacterium]
MLRDRLSDTWSDLRYRFRALFRRAAMERDLDDELRFHLEQEARKLEASGLAPDDAMRQARVAFGGVDRIKDDTRDVSGVSWLDVLSQDVRYAVRGLRARPLFTTAVVLTLGLGIGATVAMFGIVDRLLLRTPPYLADAARVHRVFLRYWFEGSEENGATAEFTRYLDFARDARTVDVVAAYAERELALGVGEDARELPVAVVSASFWRLFDASPVVGRYFTAREDSVPVGAPVVVLTHAYWKAQYGGSPDAIGQTLQVGPMVCTIIGVAPPGFVGLADEGTPVAFIPATLFGYGVSLQRGRIDYHTTYNWGWLSILVRRKPDVDVAATNADLANVYRLSWEAERAISPIPHADSARPRATAESIVLQRGPSASPVSRIAVWVAGVAAIVLLIACANVANLLLARALFRRREIALRMALGASRARLLAQVLTESVLLAALGGVAGLAAAEWGGAALRAMFLNEPGSATVLADGHALGFAVAAVVIVGILVGLVPGLQAGRAALAPSLKMGVREGTYQRSRARTTLLVLQATLSVVLLVGAGLFVRSLRNVRAMDLGFDVDPVLVALPNLRGLRLPAAERAELARRLVDAARSMPEVESAARGISVPFWSTERMGFTVPGIDSLRQTSRFTVQMASADYFQTMGTRILRGRGITDVDRADGQRVAVVSAGMAETLWPGQDAIGKCIMVRGDSTGQCHIVVGVAENTRQNSLTDAAMLQWYVPIEQRRPESALLFVRTRGDAAAHAEAVRRRLQPLMPGAGYVTVMPMREIFDPRQRRWQLGATMFVAFGGLALVLASVGLYSVIAYGVAQRTQEIGVRIALGARTGDVLRMVLGQGVRFAIVGVVLGVAVALAASRWVGPLLFSVSPTDPAVYAIVAAVLTGAAVLASLIPAVRAARVDPNEALRSE